LRTSCGLTLRRAVFIAASKWSALTSGMMERSVASAISAQFCTPTTINVD